MKIPKCQHSKSNKQQTKHTLSDDSLEREKSDRVVGSRPMFDFCETASVCCSWAVAAAAAAVADPSSPPGTKSAHGLMEGGAVTAERESMALEADTPGTDWNCGTPFCACCDSAAESNDNRN
jgi:hypothetical protein